MPQRTDIMYAGVTINVRMIVGVTEIVLIANDAEEHGCHHE